MIRLRWSILPVCATLFALAAVAAPAQAQQVAVITNPLDDPSDINGWYSYAYPFPWAVDASPIEGHDSAASLNINNGNDIDNWDYYIYTYLDTSAFDVSAEQSPILTFWCRQSFPSDIDFYQERILYFFGNSSYNQLYFGSDLNCGDIDEWHQHTIDLNSLGIGVEPFQMEFYLYCDWWYWANYLGGSVIGYQGWFIDNIQFLVADVTPPDTISDLAAGNPTLNEIEVTWSAPADDDISGIVASYDLRYSTSPINGTTFNSATQVSGEPAPAAPGTQHTLVIPGLTQDTTYYFAIQTTDIAGNVSLVSNVPILATLAPPPPPPVPTAPPDEIKDPRANDVLPCSAGTTAAPTGLLALAGLIALAALGMAVRK